VKAELLPFPSENSSPGANRETMTDVMKVELGAPKAVDRSTFQAELDALRVREKVHIERATPLRQPAGACRWCAATRKQAWS